jgi:hypothetical protein
MTCRLRKRPLYSRNHRHAGSRARRPASWHQVAPR